MVSKAFQVLSDKDKREIHDQFGGDPDSRGGGGGGGGGASSFASAGGRGVPAEMTPEELFNMFFGGGGFGGGPFGGAGAGIGGPFGSFVSFGGPGGFRVHQQFNAGGPNLRRRRPATAAGNAANADEDDQQHTGSTLLRTLVQLAPLLIFFLFPLLSSLFSELGSGTGVQKIPTLYFDKPPPLAKEVVGRFTQPRHKVPYWVDGKEVTRMGMGERQLGVMDRVAETRYVGGLQKGCREEVMEQRREVEEAMGWWGVWGVDSDGLRRAQEKDLWACGRLKELGVRRVE